MNAQVESNAGPYRWFILGATSIILFFTTGVYFYGFTAFVNPLTKEFRWTMAALGLAVTLRSVLRVVMVPPSGWMADKWGCRVPVFIGVILFGGGFVLFYYINNLTMYYIAFLTVGIGYLLSSPTVMRVAMAQWFGEKSATAMGILMAASGAGGLLVPFIAKTIDKLGWRTTAFYLGILILLVGIPLSLMISKPGKVGVSGSAGKERRGGKALTGFTLKEAIRMREFWQLGIAVLLCDVATNGFVFFQIPHIVNTGLTRQVAAWSVSGFAVAGIVGRLLFGFIGDRADRRWTYAVAVLLKASGCTMFALSTSSYMLFASVVVYAFGHGGTIPVYPAIQVSLFGNKQFGTIHGWIGAMISFGGMYAPTFTGWMFDIQKTYVNAFLILGIATALSIPLVLTLPKKRRAVAGPAATPQ